MGCGIPKQFRNLKDHPVVWWSMKAFHDEDPSTAIILVLPEQFISLWKDYFDTLPSSERFEHLCVAGGSSRTESVSRGLSAIDNYDSLVAVHDGARPLINKAFVAEAWGKAEETGAAIPVIPVTDSLRRLKPGNSSLSEATSRAAGSDQTYSCESEAVDRSMFVAVQTPQVFKTSLLKDAYAKGAGKTFSDDASVVEAAGGKVALFHGMPDNMKITNPKDLAVAAALMGFNG